MGSDPIVTERTERIQTRMTRICADLRWSYCSRSNESERSELTELTAYLSTKESLITLIFSLLGCESHFFGRLFGHVRKYS